MRGRNQMATELLEWGARLDAKTHVNNTALHLAGPALLFSLSLAPADGVQRLARRGMRVLCRALHLLSLARSLQR
jgi:hypothetical protein